MKGGMAYIRSTYNVPAKRGGLITFGRDHARILSARGPHLAVRVGRRRLIIHPTWDVKYITNAETGEGDHPTCHMCHRPLKDKASRRRGYGPGCWWKRSSLHYRELEQHGQQTLLTQEH